MVRYIDADTSNVLGSFWYDDVILSILHVQHRSSLDMTWFLVGYPSFRIFGMVLVLRIVSRLTYLAVMPRLADTSDALLSILRRLNRYLTELPASLFVIFADRYKQL